jgi:hypothetical protein
MVVNILTRGKTVLIETDSNSEQNLNKKIRELLGDKFA